MKFALFVSTFICAAFSSTVTLAEEAEKSHTTLASQSDFAFDIDVAEHWANRTHSRLFLIRGREFNTFSVDDGIAWKPHKRFGLDATLGYAYAHDEANRQHSLVFGLWAHASFLDDKLVLTGEGQRLVGGRSGYEGFYAVDWWVVGAHLLQRDKDVAAGFQIGSGPGLHPFRFDMRISFGLTDAMPDRIGCFVMSFDLR